MQQFTVPQFIDIEDKIFGPITTRQFLILLVTGGLLFIAYKLADFALFIILTVFFGGFGFLLAFLRINGQAFHYFLLNLFETYKSPGLRVWIKGFTEKELRAYAKEEPPLPPKVIPRKELPGASRLAELSLVVNTGGAYRPEEG